jgi:hypothetical protein
MKKLVCQNGDLTMTYQQRLAPQNILSRLLRTALLPVLSCAVLLFAASAQAQEFRGTISGTITDPSGAAVPNAQVTITEKNTGTINKTTSGSSGEYVVPFLPPGEYQISIETAGFKKVVRSGITLQSAEHPIIDLALSLGSTQETVNVTSEAPLVDAANASVGQVISTAQVANFPINGRTPIILTQLAVGVIATSYPSQVHPFDNNGASSFSIGGTPQQTSEILLDGSPDTTWSGAIAYSPTQESVQEVSVRAFDTDAGFGHTIGGVMNQITKSGTNAFHGSLYEFGLISNLGANSYFNKHGSTIIPRPVSHFNQFGGTIGGPVWLPKLFDGRDRLYFFVAAEGLPDSTPSSVLTTVPTAAERTGDFSALLPLGCPNGYQGADSSHCSDGTINSYQLYNPYTAQQNGSVINRSPIPNNILTSAGALSPVALAYLKFYPAANQTGKADGTQNYLSTAPATDSFNNEFVRVDWNMSAKSHIFVDYRRNLRINHKFDYFNNGGTGQGSTRGNRGATIDEVYTLNPTTVLDVRANWTDNYEYTHAANTALNPGTVGLPESLTAASVSPMLPFLNFSSGFQTLGFNSASNDPSESFQLFGDIVKIAGRHTLKFGADARQTRLDLINFGDASGSFTFGSNFVQSSSSGTAPKFGGELATFLLGLPTAGDFVQATYANYHANYMAFFAQDDWRVNDELTLNLGLRYDHQSPQEEKLSRLVNGFDPTAVTNVSSAGAAAYAANPISQLPASSFNSLGGLTYPNTPRNGAPYQTVSHWVSPRVGFSYSPAYLNKKTVFRGGFAMFVQPLNLSNLAATGTTSSSGIVNNEGFTGVTPYVATDNNYLTSQNTLNNPFPSGFLAAPGNSLGSSTFLGQNISYFAPRVYDPYSLRWNFGIQHSITPTLLVEADYVGNHAAHLPVGGTQINVIPRQLLSTMPVRDTALANSYNASVTNPYKGLLPGTSLNAATVTRAQLLSAFPQFPTEYSAGVPSLTNGIIKQNDTVGDSQFNSLSLRIEKRTNHGLSVIANYSFSKLIEATTYLNDTDSGLTRRISPFDRTHHFVTGFTYDLPIGSGRSLSFNSNILNTLLGGIKINGIYTIQSGAPIYFSNDLVLNSGETLQNLSVNSRQTNGAALSVADFNTNSAQQFAYHIRTLPQTFSYLRQDGINNLDSSLLKDFNFREGMFFELRFESFNTLNHASFAAPAVSSATSSTFGEITSQGNIPRSTQIGGRFVF